MAILDNAQEPPLPPTDSSACIGRPLVLPSLQLPLARRRLKLPSPAITASSTSSCDSAALQDQVRLERGERRTGLPMVRGRPGIVTKGGYWPMLTANRRQLFRRVPVRLQEHTIDVLHAGASCRMDFAVPIITAGDLYQLQQCSADLQLFLRLNWRQFLPLGHRLAGKVLPMRWIYYLWQMIAFELSLLAPDRLGSNNLACIRAIGREARQWPRQMRASGILTVVVLAEILAFNDRNDMYREAILRALDKVLAVLEQQETPQQ